ncbi:MAG: hypothetical protein RLY31_3202 [Bacteroidota bacterium]
MPLSNGGSNVPCKDATVQGAGHLSSRMKFNRLSKSTFTYNSCIP